jgi:hypothetical protein
VSIKITIAVAPMLSVVVSCAFILLSCSGGHVWPSKALTVRIEQGDLSALDVAKVIEKILASHGFQNVGKDGFDQINNSLTSMNFRGLHDMAVTIDLSKELEVSVRLSQRAAFSSEASEIFDEMKSQLDRRWPGAVNVEKVK